MKGSGNKCLHEDLGLVVTLFEKHTNGEPECKYYIAVDGQVSYGFYYVFLELTKHEADAEAFFQILEVDRKIGWTNSFTIQCQIYHPMSKTTKPGRIGDAVANKVDGLAKPLVAVLNNLHVVTFTGEEGDHYVFKNRRCKCLMDFIMCFWN